MFTYADVYGFGWSTTEETIPEAADRQALVDDQNTAMDAAAVKNKKMPIFVSIVAVIALAFLIGGLK